MKWHPKILREARCLLAFAAFGIPLASCTGTIGDIGNTPGGAGSEVTGRPGDVPGDPASIAGAPCENPDLRGSSRESLRRLTKLELVNTLRDLVGTALVDKFSSSIDAIPDEADIHTDKDLVPLHSQAFFNGYFELANSIASGVAASADDRTRLGGACFARDPVPSDCAESFVRTFGGRVYRRPLTQTEVSKVVASMSRLTGAPSDPVYGLVFQLLQAPEAVFHVESGVADTPVRIRLTDYEVASRISYGVTGSTPDAELVTAAAAGQLNTLEQVAAHVKRLITTPQAESRFDAFFGGWLNAAEIPRPALAVGTWAGMNVEGLDTEMRDELRDFIGHTVWKQQGKFKELMTDSSVFPRSTRLASIYGVSPVSEGAPPVRSATHSGVVLRAGMLVTGKPRTNIIHRGVFVLRGLLCETIQPPPSAADAAKEAVKDVNPDLIPNYEYVGIQTAPAACKGCHGKINQIGMAFEAFDQLGRPRTTESVLDDSGKVVAEYPLAQGPFTFELESAGTYQDAKEVAQAISESAAAKACMAANLQLHVLRRTVGTSDCGATDSFNALSAGDTVLEAMVRAVANEDIFWRRPQ
jgi:Protein of unknown function (DUF1592)/Protein of unknown function (DUF1588)